MDNKMLDEVVKINSGQKLLMDIIEIARKPDGCAIFQVDLSNVRKFRDEFRKRENVPLTYVHIIIKAVAMVLKKYPWANYMIQGYKVIKPSSIDIGCSVGAEENVTPVIVIKDADKKSLKEIVEEFREKANEAIQKERENLERSGKITRFIPFNLLRRFLLSLILRNYRVRRRFVGTFQITTLNSKDIDVLMPFCIGTGAQLAVGGIANRAVVVGSKIEIRPTVYMTLMIDHRLWNAKEGLFLLKEFKWLLEHPDELER